MRRRADHSQYLVALAWLPTWGHERCGFSLPLQNNHTELSLGRVWPRMLHKPAVGDGEEELVQCSTANNSASTLDDAVVLQFNNSRGWQTWAALYAYAATALDEWAGHGTCTGLSQSEYFGLGKAAMGLIGSGEGAALLQDALRLSDGGEDVMLSSTKLRSAFGRDIAPKCDELVAPSSVRLVCSSDCTLHEMWIGALVSTVHPERLSLDCRADFGKANSSDTCSECELVLIRRSGCGRGIGGTTKAAIGIGRPLFPITIEDSASLRVLVPLGVALLVAGALSCAVFSWWRWREQRRQSVLIASGGRLVEIWQKAQMGQAAMVSAPLQRTEPCAAIEMEFEHKHRQSPECLDTGCSIPTTPGIQGIGERRSISCMGVVVPPRAYAARMRERIDDAR